MESRTLFVSNIHCPSCISSITSILTSAPVCLSPTDFSVSLLSRLITFTSSPSAIQRIVSALTDAGYDLKHDKTQDSDASNALDRKWWETRARQQRREAEYRKAELERAEKHRRSCRACQEGESPKGKEKECMVSIGGNRPASSGYVSTSLLIDGMTCASCVGAVDRLLKADDDRVVEVTVTLLPPRALVKHKGALKVEELVERVEDGGYEATVLESKAPQHRWTESEFVIGGMTCSSCVGSLESAFNPDATVGLRSINVTLLPPKAKIVHDPDIVSTGQLVSSIEEAGYEAQLVGSVELDATRTVANPSQRAVRVRVDGMFCDKCSSALNDLLRSHQASGNIDFFTPLTLSQPFTDLVYTPKPPQGFTLRQLEDEAALLGPFRLTVIHPSDTIDSLSRQAHARESRAIAIRFIITFLFAFPTFIVAIVAMSLLSSSHPLRRHFEMPVWGSASLGTVTLFGLATPVQFGIGSFFYLRAWKSLRGVWRGSRRWKERIFRWGSMDTLVALGTTVAWASSVAFMALDVTTAPMNKMSGGTMGYFDTSVFLMLFILLGRFLEGLSKQRTGDAIEALGKMKVSIGTLYGGVDGEKTRTVNVDFLEVGDMIIIPSGSAVPLDSTLTSFSSSSTFDESSLTGEATPILKGPSDDVFAGTTNLGPSAVLAIVRVPSGKTVIDGIVDVVRAAMSHKASIERFADQITGYFVPAIVGIACLTFGIWIVRGYAGGCPESWISGEEAQRGGWALFAVQFAVAVLVVACPCGIGLAAPTAQMVGTGLCASLGIVPYGGGEAFQNATSITAVVFDKTGTITRGEFSVANHLLVSPSSDLDDGTTWELIKKVEEASSHPISVGMSKFCETKSGSEKVVQLVDSEEIPGMGLSATCELGSEKRVIKVLLGNLHLLASHGVSPSEDATHFALEASSKGQSLVYFGISSSSNDLYALAGVFALRDPPRAEVPYLISSLARKGIVSYMCTGDNESTARAVAEEVGIDVGKVRAGMKPEGKGELIRELQRGIGSEAETQSGWSWRRFKRSGQRCRVLFVGDGINDVIALNQSDVGVSMGTGASVALSSSDFCLLSSNLLSILTLLSLARATLNKIYTNFAWAIVFNTVLIPIAAGAFYDLGRTRLPPVWASLAMALSSVSVVLNSLLLRVTFRVPKEVQEWDSSTK